MNRQQQNILIKVNVHCKIKLESVREVEATVLSHCMQKQARLSPDPRLLHYQPLTH